MSEPYKEGKPGAEPEITITNAVPAGAAPVQDGPPVPPGHARFYCEKCRTVSTCHVVHLQYIVLFTSFPKFLLASTFTAL